MRGTPPADPEPQTAHPAGSGGPRRVVAHLDIDAFYASAELLRRPDLKGKPLIVGGLGPRSVVTTASYEARAYGVDSAMPMARARALCPHAVVLPPDMSRYRDISTRVWTLVRERFSVVQQAGIDEAYVDLTDVDKPLSQLRAMVAAVEEQTGMVISVGVGPSRLVAKTTSGAAKPRGFAVLSREQACAQFAGESVRKLQGIGPRTAERLAELGILTIGQLQTRSVDELTAAIGTGSGPRLHALSHFLDASAVQVSREVKSCSRETTFPQDVADPSQLARALGELAGRLCDDLERKDLAGRTVGIKVRLADWTTITRATTLPHPTRDPATVRQLVAELLERESLTAPVRLLGVRSAAFGEAPRRHAEPSRPPRDASQLVLPLAF
ncbi:MAG: DNA polymerase IV [Solirubrobacteraceae bacterium]|nr:DNA polymerase IV [Solirubrobacteraceae bacterium]